MAGLRLCIALGLMVLAGTLRAAEVDFSRTIEDGRVGVYIWDGLPTAPPGQALPRAMEIVAAAGFSTLRLVLSPDTPKTYGGDPGSCGPQATIDCIVRLDWFRKALADERFPVIVLTVQDAASRGHLRDPDEIAARRPAIERETRSMLGELADILRRNPAKRFIISNWEGDNLLLCGSSSRYRKNAEFRASCDRKIGGLDAALAGLTTWFEIRQRLTAEIRQATGVGNRLRHAVEFNGLVTTTSEGGKLSQGIPTLLDAVVPKVRPDLCSYSSYNSIHRDSMPADLASIAAVCRPGGVIVGEFGVNASGERKGPDLAAGYRAQLRKVLSSSAEHVVLWQAFFNGDLRKSFGLFYQNGTPYQLDYLRPSAKP